MKLITIRISALKWADIVVWSVLYVMQDYLTDVWEISLTHAAGIINIWNGLSKILPVFFLFLVDAFLGHFMVLVISSVAYSVGISFVVLSTPPVLGTCKEYEKECIDDAQKVIFYIGMALTATGKAGYAASVRHFRKQQLPKADKNKSNIASELENKSGECKEQPEKAEENTSNAMSSEVKNESGKREQQPAKADKNTSNTESEVENKSRECKEQLEKAKNTSIVMTSAEEKNESGKCEEQPAKADENTSNAVPEVENKLGECKEQPELAENTSNAPLAERKHESGNREEQTQKAEKHTLKPGASEVKNELGERKDQHGKADETTSNKVSEVENKSEKRKEQPEKADENTPNTTSSEVKNESGKGEEQPEKAEGNTSNPEALEVKNESGKRKDQPETTANKNTSAANCLKSILLVLLVFIAIVGAIALVYIKEKPWIIIFGIPAICTLVATLLFFSGWCKYNKVEPNGSPITNICRVFVAYFHKCSKEHPLNATDLYRKDNQESFTRTRFLRHLEKAAIIFPGDVAPDGQVKNRWKLCTVSEVEEAKIAVRMLPMWLTFIVCGIVSSIGNTYFIEQADGLNRKIGKWNVPLLVLVLLYKCVKLILGRIVNKYFLKKASENTENSTAPAYPNDKKYRPVIGIGIAMLFSILCCITAARIETKRLTVIYEQSLLDEPDDPIPMSAYWLLFQFFLLAGVEAFAEKSVAAFYTYQGPKCMEHYLGYFGTFVFGLGFMCSVLSVYVVGKISEIGGKTSWFQFTLDESRLDRYYWFLAGLSSVNLAVFVVVASCYRYKDIEKDMEGADVDIAGAEGAPPQEDDEEAKKEGK